MEAIAETSLREWGQVRSERYVLELHATFARLADFPAMGVEVSDILPGYLRFQSASHLVFYRATDSGIIIVRVLHERMDFVRHL